MRPGVRTRCAQWVRQPHEGQIANVLGQKGKTENKLVAVENEVHDRVQPKDLRITMTLDSISWRQKRQRKKTN